MKDEHTTHQIFWLEIKISNHFFWRNDSNEKMITPYFHQSKFFDIWDLLLNFEAESIIYIFQMLIIMSHLCNIDFVRN